MRGSTKAFIGLLAIFIIIAIGLVVNQAQEAFASSVSTTTKKTYVDRGQPPLSIYTLTINMDSGGTDDFAVSQAVTGRVIAVKTNPGTTAPTDNYDLDILADGADIMGAALDNRDTATTEWAIPLCGTLAWNPPLRAETLTVRSSGNLVANATCEIEIYVEGY